MFGFEKRRLLGAVGHQDWRGMLLLLDRLQQAQLTPDAALLGDALRMLPAGKVRERTWWQLRRRAGVFFFFLFLFSAFSVEHGAKKDRAKTSSVSGSQEATGSRILGKLEASLRDCLTCGLMLRPLKNINQ